MVSPRLPPGTYDLTLRSKKPDGKQATSKESVTVALEPRSTDQPVVALMTPDKPSVVLSQPAAPKPMAGAVVVEAVETEPGGKLHVSGQARPGAAVRLYLNDSLVSSVTAGADGRFAVTINEGVVSGSYRVRLDEVGSNSGAVRARAEVPFNVPDALATASVPTQATASKRPEIAAAQQPQPAAPRDRPARRKFALHRGRAEDPDYHCLPRRKPLAPQPQHLRRGHALRRHLQGQSGADPQSQSNLSRPDLCPSDAVTHGHSSSVVLHARLSNNGRQLRDHSSELFCLLCQKQIPSIRHCENGIQHLVRVLCQYHKMPSTRAVTSQDPILDSALVGSSPSCH